MNSCCPPPGYFLDQQTEQTKYPRVAFQWSEGDFHLVTERDITKGTVLWEESAVLAFGKDPKSPLNYGGSTERLSEAAVHTNLHKRLAHLPAFIQSLKIKGWEDQPESFSLQLCFLSHCFNLMSGPRVWAWLRWCPWANLKHMFPNSESDARTATTFSAAVLQALPEDLKSSVGLVDLVRLWFIGTRGAIRIMGGDGAAPTTYAVFHYLSVARRMRCEEVVNCRMEMVGLLEKESPADAESVKAPPIRVRAVASQDIPRGHEVCVSMNPIDMGPIPEDISPELMNHGQKTLDPQALKERLVQNAMAAHRQRAAAQMQ